METHLTLRHSQILKLLDFDMVNEALNLAEKYRDMTTLVDLVTTQLAVIDSNLSKMSEGSEEYALLKSQDAALHERIEDYYSSFGKSWASALYKKFIATGFLANVISDRGSHQHFLTEFLRSDTAYSKISWMNEVLGEKDFGKANEVLLGIGQARERDLFTKKVELSIGKLARLAELGNGQSENSDEFRKIDDSLALINMQEKVYGHVRPIIHGAIDQKAEVQLAMQEIGIKDDKRYPAFSNLLESAVEMLVQKEYMGEWMLIDLLTLMEPYHDPENPESISGQEFYLALKVLQHSDMPSSTRTLVEKLIWRRCLLRDDWVKINDTKLLDDNTVDMATRNTALFALVKAGYKDRKFDLSFAGISH
jgi:nuclear pore complex protein Nup133